MRLSGRRYGGSANGVVGECAERSPSTAPRRRRDSEAADSAGRIPQMWSGRTGRALRGLGEGNLTGIWRASRRRNPERRTPSLERSPTESVP